MIPADKEKVANFFNWIKECVDQAETHDNPNQWVHELGSPFIDLDPTTEKEVLIPGYSIPLNHSSIPLTLRGLTHHHVIWLRQIEWIAPRLHINSQDVKRVFEHAKQQRLQMQPKEEPYLPQNPFHRLEWNLRETLHTYPAIPLYAVTALICLVSCESLQWIALYAILTQTLPIIANIYARNRSEPIDMKPALIRYVIVGPLVEESIFRGMLQPLLCSALGTAPSILISGFLFGAYHQDETRFVQSTIAVNGLFYGFMAHTYGFGAALLTHAVHNGNILLTMPLITNFFIDRQQKKELLAKYP